MLQHASATIKAHTHIHNDISAAKKVLYAVYGFATKIDISLSPPFYVSRDTGWEWCAHAPKLWQDFYSIYGVYLAQREGLTFLLLLSEISITFIVVVFVA